MAKTPNVFQMIIVMSYVFSSSPCPLAICIITHD